MAETRRDLLRRFAAAAIAAACGGRAVLAEEAPPPQPQPRMMALYGPAPTSRPVPDCGPDRSKPPCGPKPPADGDDNRPKRPGG
jgi:hypothetical protein